MRNPTQECRSTSKAKQRRFRHTAPLPPQGDTSDSLSSRIDLIVPSRPSPPSTLRPELKRGSKRSLGNKKTSYAADSKHSRRYLLVTRSFLIFEPKPSSISAALPAQPKLDRSKQYLFQKIGSRWPRVIGRLSASTGPQLLLAICLSTSKIRCLSVMAIASSNSSGRSVGT